MKELKKWIVLLAALFVLTGMMSCEMFSEDDDDIAVKGTWNAGFGSEIVITNSTYSNYYNDVLSYKADIVSFDNDGWYGSETGSGDYGYMVIQYTQASAYTPESQDKYMVVRWQDVLTVGDLKTMSYSEGSDYPTNTYFDSKSEAKEGATAAAGFFGYFSTTTEVDE